MELSQRLEQDPTLLRYFDLTAIHRKWIMELAQAIQEIPQGEKLPPAALIHLYSKGFTYEELATLTGRIKQSVFASISSKLSPEDIDSHKKRRSLWVNIHNYLDYAYEADLAGTWDYLTLKYPGVSLSTLKQRYRNNGGTYLFSLRDKKRRQEMLLIAQCIESEMTPKQMAETLKIPLTTVYLRLWDVLQEKYPDTPIDTIKEAYFDGKLDEL